MTFVPAKFRDFRSDTLVENATKVKILLPHLKRVILQNYLLTNQNI